MIRYIISQNLLNMYAFVIEPTAEEKKELIEKGFSYFSNYTIKNEEDNNNGKKEEMWIK